MTEKITPTVITDYTCTSHRADGTVTDAEPLAHPYHRARLWKPQKIVVQYYFDVAADQWVCDKTMISGVYIKQDGTPGLAQTSVSYWEAKRPLPQWALDFIGVNTPPLGLARQPAATPLHIDAACCQSCGWRGLESEVAHVMRSDGIAIECPMCPSTDINYCARTQTDG